MTDAEILTGIKKYFAIHELVGQKTYEKYGDKAWQFIDIRLLHVLLVIRTNLNKPITINNWFLGGEFSQRGLRSNIEPIFKTYFRKKILYLSGHIMGKAIDFDVEGMTANEVREWLVENDDLLPCKIRLERKLKGNYISWVHLDVFYNELNSQVYLFDV